MGIAYLTITVAGLGLAGVALRRRLLRTWEGAPARLAELVLAISALVVAAELLGSFGVLTPAALLAAIAAVASAAWLLGRRQVGGGEVSPRPPAPPTTRWATALAIVVALVATLHWSGGVQDSLDHGIYRQDSTWYHLPFSAAIFQMGDTWAVRFTDPMALTAWFYPQNSELLHAIGMLGLGTDFLSVFVNIGWMVLALLAAWCVGRPFDRGPEALIGAALVLDTDMMQVQSGNAPNDTAGVFLLLATMALLVKDRAGGRVAGRWRPDTGPLPDTGALFVAALAAGLAIGTKISLLAPIAVLTVGLLWVVGRAERLRVAAIWLGGVAVTGGYWYLRDLFHAGNPLPWISAGPLPAPDQLSLYPRPAHSVADYATDAGVWLHQFAPALDRSLGPLWPLVLAAAAAGLVLAVARGPDLQRVLGAAGIAAAIAYVFIPVSASGSPGHPSGFETNLRYLTPALAAGLVLLPVQVGGMSNWSRFLAPALGALFVAGALSSSTWQADRLLPGAVLALVLVAVPVAVALLAARGARPAHIAAPIAAAVLVVVGVGYPSQRDYLDSRYLARLAPPADNPGFRDTPQWRRIQAWARDVDDARIGVAGPPAAFGQYIFYGSDLTNRVEYIGESGPHGSYRPIDSCRAWRRSINRRHLRFVVVTPAAEIGPGSVPQESLWTRGDPAARLIVRAAPGSVYRISGELDPTGCQSEGLPPTVHVPGGGFAVPGTGPRF